MAEKNPAPHDVAYYLDKVPGAHSDKPKYTAMLSMLLKPFVEAQALASLLFTNFDLDNAVGVQLDVVGKIVGRSREITTPVEDIWFSFGGDGSRGFGRGVWRGLYSDQTTISRLDDETYRKLIRATIIANTWDGSIDGAQAALDAFFDDPETHVFVNDEATSSVPIAFFGFGRGSAGGFGRGVWKRPGDPDALPGVSDMSMTIGVSGKIPNLLYLFLLVQDLISVKPGGVKVRYMITSVNRTPLFGFGVQNEYVSGFGSGSWGTTPDNL